MNKVFILQDVIIQLRNQLWEKVHNGNVKYSVYGDVVEYLRDKYPENTDIKEKIKWFLKAFSKGKGVTLDSEPYKTFIIICNVLGVNVKKINEKGYDMTTEHIVKQLGNLHIITKELLAKQLAAWELKVKHIDEYPIKYTGYYSRGSDTPDVALLRLNKAMTHGELYFDDDDIHSATVTVIGNQYVFIKLENPKTHYESLITLKTQRVAGKHFDSLLVGYYCTVLTEDPGGPAAGKMIFERGDNYQEAKNKFPAKYKAQLMHERLRHRSNDNNLKLSSIIGNYEGYWFVDENEGLFLRKVAINIGEDGTCTMIDKNKHEVFGYVLWANEKDHVIKLGFDIRPNSESFDFRSQMIFELRTLKNGYLDGVYSGQRESWGKIMAGKIRIYQTNQDLRDIDLTPINFNNIDPLKKNRAKDVMDFFWGIPAGRYSSDFIQPNLPTFDRWFNKFILKDNKIEQYSGKYLLFRQDSTENRINQYQITINKDRSVLASLRLDPEAKPITYNGTAIVILDCLMINIHLKNNEPYDALYIHFIGPEKRSAHKYFTGVFATIGDVGTPLCGRSVLKPVVEHYSESPIKISSKEYLEKNKEYSGLLYFLTGRENNLIKTANKINRLQRQIQYGDVFFGFACSPELDNEKRVKFLKYAFEHNFKNFPFLEKQMEVGGGLHFLSEQKRLTIVNDTTDKQKFKIMIKTDGERLYTYEGWLDDNT